LFSGTAVSDFGTENTIGSANTTRNVSADLNGDIYVAYANLTEVRVAKSTNGGQTFLSSVLVGMANFAQPEIAINNNGIIFIAWTVSGSIYFSSSDNSGLSYSNPRIIGTNSNGNVHMSTFGNNVYLTNQIGTDFYSNNNNGIGTFNRISTNVSMVYADALTDQNGVVYLPMDDPNLLLFQSIDEGISLNQTTLNPPSLVFFSSYALSDGPCGTFIFVAGGGNFGSETLGYKINVETGVLTEITFGENIITEEGRTLFADGKGTLIDGYRNSDGDLAMNVSSDQGNNFNAPIIIASGESHNISRNPVTEDVLVVYQSSGEIFLSVYDNILKNIEIPEINPPLSLCPNQSFDLPFNISDGFNPNTEFTVSLSDEFGSFSNPTQIGSIITNSSGTINCTIPSNAVTSNLYRIQIESLDDCIQSNKISLTIGIATITGPAEVCVNNTIQLNGSGIPNPTTPWTSSNTTIATIDNLGVITALSSGTTEITYTTSDNCSGTYSIEVLESPIPNTNIPNLSFCDNTSVGTETDGYIEFNLTDRESDIVNGQSISDFTITYFIDAARSNQITNPTAFQNTIANGQPIYVRMTSNLNSTCFADATFIIEVFEFPTVTSIVELRQCDDDIDGYSLFNLNEVFDEISTNAINETITFHESLAEAEIGDNPIPNPTTYENEVLSSDIVWASIKSANNCIRTSQVNLFVSTTQIPATFATRNFYECDDTTDGDSTNGISSFDFSSINSEIEALFPVSQQLSITYYRNLADALAENNLITDISNYRNIDYPNTQNIYIRIDNLANNDCLGLGSHITLNVEIVPVANPITIPDECDDDGDDMVAFDSSNYESTIIGSQTDVNVIYIDENGITLPSPLPNPFLTGSQTVTVRVENALSQDIDGACYDETTITFSIDAAAVANPIDDFIECDDDFDNLYSFDTSTIESTVLNGQTGMIVTYTDSNGLELPSPLPNPFLTTNTTITVRVENPINTICFDETTFDFIVRERPQFELINEDLICLTENPSLDVETFNPNGTYTYQWTGPNGFSDTGETTTVFEGGIYSVIATSDLGCPSFEKEITIFESELASISLSDIQIIDDSNNNTITILTTNLGIGDYEFALDDEFGTYQDEPVFYYVIPGIHIIYIRDKNNCGTNSIEVYVLGFPKFFTPNDDGINDYWNIKGVDSNIFPNSKIYIYDRFGKVISIIDSLSNGWDGFYIGKRLPETDYWFSVQLIDNEGNIRNRKGHFSLIRR
jgi:gliding motility-associated-like protein